MNCCSSQIVLLVHNIIHVSWTQFHIEGGGITSFAKKQTMCKTMCLMFMNNIATLNYLVSIFFKKKEIIGIISTLQITEATSSLKIQVEIILDVSHLNLVLGMAIMFLVHSLHLTKVTVETNKRGQFKQHITTKCGWNAMNNLNMKTIIVQIF